MENQDAPGRQALMKRISMDTGLSEDQLKAMGLEKAVLMSTELHKPYQPDASQIETAKHINRQNEVLSHYYNQGYFRP